MILEFDSLEDMLHHMWEQKRRREIQAEIDEEIERRKQEVNNEQKSGRQNG